MHWTASEPGNLDAERELRLVEQTPGDVVFVSTAETDLLLAARVWPGVFGDGLRIVHAGPLRQPVASDDFIDRVVRRSKTVIFRLLGGEPYFPHLFQALLDLKQQAESEVRLLFVPGAEGEPVPDWAEPCEQLADYFRFGGERNLHHAALLLAGRPAYAPEPTEECAIFYSTPSRGPKHAALVFYRAFAHSGDADFVQVLCNALEMRGISVDAISIASMRDDAAREKAAQLIEASNPDILLLTLGFAVALNAAGAEPFFSRFGCPVLQIGASSQSIAAWTAAANGLPPAENAMYVALPELDGRIFSTVCNFREPWLKLAGHELRRTKAENGRANWIAELAKNWARLRGKPNAEKRIAIIFANYPNRDGRIANGVGLDTPASAVALLEALAGAGYLLPQCPRDGLELMGWLTAGPTNDPELSYGKTAAQSVHRQELDSFVRSLPAQVQEAFLGQWDLSQLDETIPVPGVRLGNVFLGIQPPRGFSMQTSAVYHSPELLPPPQYLSFYYWLRFVFECDAVIHLGKHGNLEWLPGRPTGLGDTDWPQICLGPVPHLYPFIVNNPGEGSQAKRRTQAVIIDHLTPPIARAELYDDLRQAERLLEEYEHLRQFAPAKAERLLPELEALLEKANWSVDLGERKLERLGAFLCDLKENQIRNGLHILGKTPENELLVDFILSVLRVPSTAGAGLLELFAGDEAKARTFVAELLDAPSTPVAPLHQPARDLIVESILPKVRRCEDELFHILRALDGRFVPPGPSGAPTRGRLDVLPTGRNFFSIDPRVIPTPSAWRCGQQLADRLLERHRQDTGKYPETLAMVVWGTSNMRTGGDDIAQALALWGCEPVWDEGSGRVIDFRILPLTILGRPRVDVTLRVSGLFRDAFGETMRLLAAIPKRLAMLEEPPDRNPIRKRYLSNESVLRVFSSAPGAYGAGLLPLLDGGNWRSRADLAEVFIRWGSHAYDAQGEAVEAAAELKQRLAETEVVHQNQDNREHDILDSDDYFQFQGGLHATVAQLRGEAPATYHGDSSAPDTPKIRTLGEELVRVFWSRAVNPQWIQAMRKHGYKGAFEIAATVDYLFGYSATTDLVRSEHFAEAARRLLLDPEQIAFFQQHNPAALREAGSRLLEAAQRGLWQDADPALLDALADAQLLAEGSLE